MKAAEETCAADDKAFASKTQLKQAVKGLQTEFPLLGSIARMALNPITLVVAGLASAWHIWTSRVEAATKALGGVVMPDITDAAVGRVNRMAEAWKDYGDSVNKAMTAFTSIEAAFRRKEDQEKKELERQKKLIEAQKKAGMISESEAEAQTNAAEEGSRAGGLRARDKKVSDLVASSKRKMAEAAAIKVGSPEDEERTDSSLKSYSDFAAKWRDELLQGNSEINDFLDDPSAWYSRPLEKKYGYGTRGAMRDQLVRNQEMLDRANAAVKKHRDFVGGKPDRERLRGRRSTLLSEAGAEAGAAATEYGELYAAGGAFDQARADSVSNRQVAGVNLAGSLRKAREEERAALNEMLNAAEAGTGVSDQLMARVKALTERVAELTKRERDLEGRPPRM